MRLATLIAVIGAAVGVATSFTACRRPPSDIEAVERAHVTIGLHALSLYWKPLLETGAVTNIDQLRAEYSRMYQAGPIFTPTNPAPAELPPRRYFWLRYWDAHDAPDTPLLWTYFNLPSLSAAYISIDGTDHISDSNTVFMLVQPLSNRVEATIAP